MLSFPIRLILMGANAIAAGYNVGVGHYVLAGFNGGIALMLAVIVMLDWKDLRS